MGKLTISMAIFNSYVKLPEGKESEKKMVIPMVSWFLSHIKCSKTSNQFTHPGKLMEESTQQQKKYDRLQPNNQE